MISPLIQDIRVTKDTITASELQTYRRNFQARLDRQRERREALRLQALRAARQAVPPILATWPSVRRAYLFGSITRPGAFHRESDIDIAITGATAQDYFAIWRAIERALPDWPIDLRDISTPSTFADRVRRTGMLIYDRTDTSPTGRDTG